MSLSGIYGAAEDAQSEALIHHAIETGINHLDSSDMYGWGHNEEVIGRALKGRRDKVVLATKFGQVRRDGQANAVDGRAQYVVEACEASLNRLGVDVIDLYYQHRVDPKTPIEETVGALAKLVAEGKVRHIGLSEAAPATIRRAHAVHPVAALQTEYSLWTRDPEAELLPLLRALGIGFVPYSPLGHGFLTGKMRSPDELAAGDWRKNNPRFAEANFHRNLRIVREVEAVAAEVGATSAQVALAWLLAQGNDIAPIPGTKRVARVEENTAADHIELSPRQIAQLNTLTPAAGERHNEESMSFVDR